jgi:hypothetical protein
MALFSPLVFDASRGLPTGLAPTDILWAPGGIQIETGVGFYGAPLLTTQPVLDSNWANLLDQICLGLGGTGLFADSRPEGWDDGLQNLVDLGDVGPYEPGRLIIGGVAGWQQLDQPAITPNVIQVPTAHAGTTEINPVNGLPVRQLAYSPILTYGPTPPPTTPQIGALWVDTTTSRLQVWNGDRWQPVLGTGVNALVDLLAAGRKGQLMLSDGAGGALLLEAATARTGAALVLDSAGQHGYAELLYTARQAPWSNGASAFDGQRPAGVSQAIWCNTTPGAEAIGFWDESAHLWRQTPVSSPVLQQLAGLRAELTDGDLLSVAGGQIVRLGAGSAGHSLTAVDGRPVWRQRFHQAETAPTTAVDGDIWLESSSGVIAIRDQNQWVPFSGTPRYRAINSTGAAIAAGTPLVAANGWSLADTSTASGALVGVALEAAAAGAPVAVAIGGVVALPVSSWAVVCGSLGGLETGADYYLSAERSGQISTIRPATGAIGVGTALSATQLLIRTLVGAQPAAAVRSGSSAPTAQTAGELWWNDSAQRLEVSVAVASGLEWRPAIDLPGGSSALVDPAADLGKVVADLEVIDWAPDPRAAAIRMFYADGTTGDLRIRGAGGTVVTMSDNHTMVIDSASSPAPDGGGGGGGHLPAGGNEGDVLTWLSGAGVWNPLDLDDGIYL